MIVVILYDQIELNNHNLKSSIINEIVLLFNNKKILNHRHYEKRKKQSILEELIHIVINIIRFTETTVQPVLQKRFTKFVSPRNKSSSKYANIWWCRIETHVSLPCEKKKRTFNPRSMIYDCLGNVSRIPAASGPVALPCFLAISQNGIKFQPTAFGGNKGVNLVPTRLICCPNRCAISRGISGAKQFVLQM